MCIYEFIYVSSWNSSKINESFICTTEYANVISSPCKLSHATQYFDCIFCAENARHTSFRMYRMWSALRIVYMFAWFTLLLLDILAVLLCFGYHLVADITNGNNNATSKFRKFIRHFECTRFLIGDFTVQHEMHKPSTCMFRWIYHLSIAMALLWFSNFFPFHLFLSFALCYQSFIHFLLLFWIYRISTFHWRESSANRFVVCHWF